MDDKNYPVNVSATEGDNTPVPEETGNPMPVPEEGPVQYEVKDGNSQEAQNEVLGDPSQIAGGIGPQQDVTDKMIEATTDPAADPLKAMEAAAIDAASKVKDAHGREWAVLAKPAGERPMFAEVPGPMFGKEYGEPTWQWWQNQHGTWNATATFTSTDGEDIQKVVSPLINWQKDGNNVTYTAEADFGDTTYTNSMTVGIDLAEGADMTGNAGRGLTNPMGAYGGDTDGKVIPFPTAEDKSKDGLNAGPVLVDETHCAPKEEGEQNPEAGEGEPAEPPKAIEDEENPINELSEQKLGLLLRQLQEGVKMMESIWRTTRQEFNLNDGIMKELYKFNDDHAEKMPEDLSKEEQEKWDNFNGLDKLTEEDVVRIFGAEHNIIGVEHEVTVGRIKECCHDLFAWTYALREYTNVHNAYMALIEDQEARYIQELKAHAEAEEDPEKRKAMLDSIEFYYYRKNLGFLANPDEITPEVRARIHRAWKDEKKIDYWLKRTREKLGRMKISTKAILEISSFEKRYLPERYHVIDNALLTYFLNICTYCKPDDKRDASRNMVTCMVFALDQVIRNVMPEKTKEEVIKNILVFEEWMRSEITGEPPMLPKEESEAEEPAEATEAPAPDMSELPPEEKPDSLAGDFSNGTFPETPPAE